MDSLDGGASKGAEVQPADAAKGQEADRATLAKKALENLDAEKQ